MKKILGLGMVLVCGMTLAACGGGNSESGTSAEPAKSAQNTKTSTTETQETQNSSVEQEAEKDLNQGEAAKYSTDWSEDWDGLKFSIPEVSIALSNDELKKDAMIEGEAIMGVNFVFENTAKNDFDTYPDQATAVVNGQQVEAEMLASDNLGGEILSGVKKEGLVVFDIPKLDDPKSVDEIRLKWNSSNPDAEDMDNMYHEYDVTIKLK